MIETWKKHIVYVTLHDKRLTDKYKEMYPDRPECWDSPIDVDIEDIYRLEKTKEGKAIIWIPRDDQGGGMSVEVLEDYDELYDLLVSKSEYVKIRIGKKIV
jgi:hypothetical protein